jgi:polyhydroxyalkanoate synthesis regulator phasin
MKESVAVAKEADAKKGVSPTKDNSIPRVRDEPERQLGSLRGVIGNIRRDGGTPSVESIATELSGMSTGGRAPALLALQRTHGNRYVQRVVSRIQAKLVVGQPGDVYEQEADRVADEVMRMPEPEVKRQIEDEEELLQPKLEASSEYFIPRQIEEADEEEVLQTKNRENTTSEVTNDLESRIQAIRGGGQPLAESERSFFEPRFGYDFSEVRVHTDLQAAESAQVMNARAFTIGRDIVFNKGEYAPETVRGGRLLAHELTHVIQQRGNKDVKTCRRLYENEAQEKARLISQPNQRRTAPAVRGNCSYTPALQFENRVRSRRTLSGVVLTLYLDEDVVLDITDVMLMGAGGGTLYAGLARLGAIALAGGAAAAVIAGLLAFGAAALRILNRRDHGIVVEIQQETVIWGRDTYERLEAMGLVGGSDIPPGLIPAPLPQGPER